ncbi:sulfite exporter TauE/SafE family protein [Photobacterium carnosum]|uniref:sulfite exporter TauE/SafE family protein n=1 Tax=Photobacterium carnosum TaxID=2023717 RepID=UPI001E5464B5|nr:sulfite exporter TauE/SafE family protein [Photobacterium carnosum]MCD9514988.1 TSUP family transporter [Photobacterium carnosum]
MTIDPTALLAMIMIFLGSFVQTAIGFGLAIVSAPILIIIAPQYVPAPICLVALFISLLNSLKHRNSIELGGLKMAILGRIPGSIAGATLLVFVSTQSLSLWVGLLVLLAVFISIMPFRIEPTPKRMVIAGFFSGLFGTSSAIGGPPMAILLQHQEANQLRGNLSAFFVFSSIISLITLIPVGFLNIDKLWLTLPLLPAAWAGYWLALKTTQSLPKQTIRYGALTLCFICGFIAIYKSLI